jgi:hypothetical protein
MVLVDKILPKLRDEGHRVLIFSQFIRVLTLILMILIVQSKIIEGVYFLSLLPFCLEMEEFHVASVLGLCPACAHTTAHADSLCTGTRSS